MAETYDGLVGGIMNYAGAVLQLSASGATGQKAFDTASAQPEIGLSIAMKTSGGAPPVASRDIIGRRIYVMP